MKLGSLIDKDYILVGDEFKSVGAAIDRFLELFNKKRQLPISVEEVRKIVAAREELGGTVSRGMSIPHGRIDGFNDLLMGVWVPGKPLETPAGTVKVVFFSLTSKSGTALYLPVLAALARLSSNEALFSRLIAADNRNTVQDIFDEITLKQEVVVGDIMQTDPVTCVPETTLAELADLFYMKGISFLPVVDKEGRQVGEVTVKDLLSRGVPDYVRRLGNLKFLKTLEPFEALLRDEDKITVSEIMRKPSRKISPDSSIIEAVAIITGKSFRHLPVVEGDRVIGMISETDILKKVLRG